MAIRFYDDALVNKIKKWVGDTDIVILKPDETSRLFGIKADQNKDQPLKLPLIALSRDSTIEITSTTKKPLTFDGLMYVADHDSTIQLDAIPITIRYQLDIYTRYADEADDYLRNFVFNFVNYPKLTVTLPYNDSRIEHDSNVRLLSNVEDNSDISQRLFPDQFTRWTLYLEIDDAYIFSVPVKKNVHIEVEDEEEILAK